jgi:hypothetical protein
VITSRAERNYPKKVEKGGGPPGGVGKRAFFVEDVHMFLPNFRYFFEHKEQFFQKWS